MLQAPHRYVYNPLIVMRDGWKIRRFLRKHNPDVVHFMAEPLAFFLPLIGRGHWKAIMTLHATYAVLPCKRGGFARWFARKSYEQSDGIVAVSTFTKSYATTSMPELKLEKKIRVIRNAIAADIPAHVPKKVSPKPSIIGVGAVKNRKGYIQAVEACATFKKQYGADFTYDIIGSLEQDPVYATALRARIDELGLASNVRLRGSVDSTALKEAYRNADLFLLLSQHEGDHVEGFGLVFLEASARGVPVIGPNTGGCPEAIDDGQSGYVVNPNDAVKVAEKMKAILIDHTIKNDDCLAWARKNTIRDAAQTLAKYYEELKA